MINKPKTSKQKKFFANIARGDTQHQAAIKAGYKAPGASASQNIENYKDYWSELLNKAGATDEVLAQTISEGLKSIKPIGEGVLTCADYAVRAKYVDIALKLKSAYPAEKREISGSLTFKDFVEKAVNE